MNNKEKQKITEKPLGENLSRQTSPQPLLTQISQEETDIINDIRGLNYGRITIFVQDGVVISKEITRVVKSRRNCGYNNSNSGAKSIQ